MQKREFSIEVAGEKMTAQFNDLADQTNGSVMLSCGDTVVLATAVMSPKTNDDMSYFPLKIDYEERFYATGQILGSRFTRREGRPSENAILSGRIIDRTIRPLFEQYIRNDIQLIITVLSIGKYNPDILATNAASIAIAVSDIPFNGPVSAMRIGKNVGESEFVVNPEIGFEDLDNFEMELIACGKDSNINMVEVESKEVSDEMTVSALQKASEEIEKIQQFQKDIIKEIGKEKTILAKPETPSELEELFKEKIESRLDDAVFGHGAGKKGIEALKEEWKELFTENLPDINRNTALDYYEDAVNDLMHKEAIENNRRADGRKMDEVRSLFAQAGGISPVIHGTGIFYRGGTHVFSALTLGGPDDTLLLESLGQEEKRRYIHQYNFPPFSVGETGRVGGFNRRMIGHGALAEKALKHVIPDTEKFPYTMRILSESMASNGSTSMASVCGSTIALMDGGVPIKAPVAGIASGLMMESADKYKVLTDIQGPEDHHGDMDFKVAGTRKGITAIQMDVKVDGIPIKILEESLEKAGQARFQILDVIEAEIKEPRADISPRAPKILVTKIKPTQIGLVIGPGGKTVNEIRDNTGAEISIEDDGTVYVTGKDGSAEKAKVIIDNLVKEYRAGDVAEGEVVKVFDFGAVVKISPTKDGLVHISEIAPFRIEKVTDFLKEGMKVPVKVKEVDREGKMKLSIKDAKSDLFKKK
ncbi:polyribonucleotide nucleotidyltransferase [Patescibacteria group bacterium]